MVLFTINFLSNMFEAQVEILAALSLLHFTRGARYSCEVSFDEKLIVFKFSVFLNGESYSEQLFVNTPDAYNKAKELSKKLLNKYL